MFKNTVRKFILRKGEKVMAIIGLITVFTSGVVLQGFALKILWAWFVVPTFQLPGLSIPAALGLSMVASYLTHQYNKDERSVDGQIVYPAFECLLVLVIGWIIHLFM
ncbi:MAG: hypothetical protein Q8P91_02605 [bacterium]|nr:hypothetical protein [bacterium]